MQRILEFSDAANVTASSDDERAAPPPPGVVRWIDVTEPDAVVLERLRGRFDLHPLAIEDCLQFDQRAKLEEYRNHLFIVTHAYECASDAIPERSLELHTFLGEGWMITVRATASPTVDHIWARSERDPALGRRGADYLFYLLSDALADANLPALDLIDEELARIEDAALGKHPKKHDLARILKLKRNLLAMRRVIAPQRELFAALAKRFSSEVSERSAPYFREVYDAVMRVTDAIDAAREQVVNTLNAHLSVLSNRTNEIMKSLTLLSAIFLPLTFITGFFGQNFEHLPFHSPLMMGVMLGACVLVPSAMLWWFRSRHWL